MKLKKIIKEIVKGIIPALPFGNVVTEIQNKVAEIILENNTRFRD